MIQRSITKLLLLLAVTGSLYAQVPATMSYQAVARDAEGECIANQTISLQISILGDDLNGPVVYRERFEGNVQTNAVGHFQVDIGSGTPQTGGEVSAFDQIRWNNRSHYLRIEYAPGATTAFTEVGTAQLLSVPYALAAGNGKLFSTSNLDEFFFIRGANGLQNVIIGGRPDDTGAYNRGSMLIRDEEENVDVHVFSTSSGGWMYTRGPNGNRNIELSVLSGTDYPNNGTIRIRDEQDQARMQTGVASSGAGYLNLLGPNGLPNVFIGNRSNDANRAAMTFRDENGDSQVSIYIDNQGNGRVDADGANGGIKSFVMPHPNYPNKDIVYASLEGPEAGAYERGTDKLIDGEAFVPFSETFGIVANPETMTILTSPWSSDSKGLAVVERTAEGFRVKELYGGTGTYRFDWEVKAVRRGWEDFEVIRDRPRDEQLLTAENDAGHEE